MKNLNSTFITILLVWACFAFLPPARAVLPPPDGGYLLGNTAEGEDALFSLTTGSGNTAVGSHALYLTTSGGSNTGTGFHVLEFNTTGSSNTATGSIALWNNTTGSYNTATGNRALVVNRTGSGNTATGYHALSSNTGTLNTATGYQALDKNTRGFGNTATGPSALLNNTTGNNNTADGLGALNSNTTGSGNIALGILAGEALTTGSNNIDIGNAGVAAEANTIRIGTQGTQTATFIAGISGTPLGGGEAVRVNANGQLGTVGSSVRFKQDIEPMDKESDVIHALKPVTFRYKKNIDPAGTAQFGLVAEEVEKVNPDLVARDGKGEIYTVRYDAVNAMLLNEFLKEHRNNQELQCKIDQQEAKIARQEKQLQALTAGLKTLSDQIKMSRVSANVASNGR